MNAVIDSRPSEELSNAEVEAYLYRLLRSAPEKATAQGFMRKARKMFPDMPEKRLLDCVKSLMRRL